LLADGHSLTLRGPAGTCCHVPEEGSDDAITSTGTGSGLAPLIGIAKQALGCGHRGEIQLFHGALQAPDLVNVMRRKAFLGGIASKHIFADLFLPSKPLQKFCLT